MTLRNLILIVFLVLFFGWYIASWAYNTQYLEPRTTLTAEIDELSQQIVQGETNLAAMKQFNEQAQRTYWLYPRSLPPASNDARQYSFLLLEMLQYSGLENNDVRDYPPTFVPLGADYRFQVQCTGTLSQLTSFLAEFYSAPFLHRLTFLTLTPMEGDTGILTFSMTINVLAMNSQFNPYPVTNQLPGGWYYPRLSSGDLSAYHIIEERNLLQVAKGGIDRADFTRLTGLPQIGGQTEAWFSVQTDDTRIRAKLGDTIRSGSFIGRIVEIHEQDIVLDRDGARWLLTLGESLHQAFALPPETGGGAVPVLPERAL